MLARYTDAGKNVNQNGFPTDSRSKTIKLITSSTLYSQGRRSVNITFTHFNVFFSFFFFCIFPQSKVLWSAGNLTKPYRQPLDQKTSDWGKTQDTVEAKAGHSTPNHNCTTLTQLKNEATEYHTITDHKLGYAIMPVRKTWQLTPAGSQTVQHNSAS